MKTSITLAFIFCFLSSFAQKGNLTGKVINEDTKEPLIGATLILLSDPSIGGVTDIDGIYTIDLEPGKHKIICRFTSMESDTFEVSIVSGAMLSHDVSMHMYKNILNDVEVHVGKFDKPIEDLTVSMEVIKPAIIENKNTRSVETILDQTPGLNILDGEPQIRGGSGFTFGVGSKVAVLLDDMPMVSGDAGRPIWDFIPIENIEQIEVIKGASSVLSGAGALSGAIHVRTAYPREKPITKIHAYTGMYSAPKDKSQKWYSDYPGIHGFNFLHSQKFGHWDLVVGGLFNYDHGYIGPPRQDSTVTFFDPSNPNPDTISNFSNKQMASIKGRINFNLRHRSKRFKGLAYGLNGNIMYNKSNMAFAWLNDSSGLYQGYPGAVFLQNQFMMNLDPFITFFQETGAKHSLRGRIMRADNQITGKQSNQANTFFGDYQFQRTFKVLKNLEFIGGISGMYTHSFAQLYVGSGKPINTALNLSAYAQLEKKFFDILTLSLGGRLEYYKINDTIKAIKPIFRAGANIKLFQETYLRTSFGQGYRFPTITERFIRTGVGNIGMFPNPYLKPESSWNAEVGIKQGLKFGGLMGYLDVAAFYQHYENTIEYLFGFWGDWMNAGNNPTNTPAGFKFVNTGKSRVVGLDISFNGFAKLGKYGKMTFMAGYNYIVPTSLNPNYVYSSYTLPGGKQIDLSYDSTSLNPKGKVLKYRFLHNVKADISFSWKGFAIGMTFKYFSRLMNLDKAIYQFEDYTTNQTGGSLQPIRYMNYYYKHNHGNPIVDARISYEINNMHKFALISSNLLNRSYSLRPLKIEAPRTIMLQYTLTIDRNKNPKKERS
jgi:iron complex outermembrane receptor protein